MPAQDAALPEYLCEEHDNIGDDELTDSNTRDLEPMFTDPTATLNAMQKDWWNGCR